MLWSKKLKIIYSVDFLLIFSSKSERIFLLSWKKSFSKFAKKRYNYFAKKRYNYRIIEKIYFVDPFIYQSCKIMKKFTAKLSLSKTTKIWLLISYLYSVFLFIDFASWVKALEHLSEINYLTVVFAEQAWEIGMFVSHLIYGKSAHAAVLGMLLIWIVFLITLRLDIKNQQISKKSFLLTLGLFVLALAYPCFILWGHGFINYF